MGFATRVLWNEVSRRSLKPRYHKRALSSDCEICSAPTLSIGRAQLFCASGDHDSSSNQELLWSVSSSGAFAHRIPQDASGTLRVYFRRWNGTTSSALHLK